MKGWGPSCHLSPCHPLQLCIPLHRGPACALLGEEQGVCTCPVPLLHEVPRWGNGLSTPSPSQMGLCYDPTVQTLPDGLSYIRLCGGHRKLRQRPPSRSSGPRWRHGVSGYPNYEVVGDKPTPHGALAHMDGA